jgi:hypothetical protein
VILSCTATTKDTSINVAFDLDMLNPGGMHISLEKAPLVPMFYTLLAIYMVMCGACTMMDSTLRLGKTPLPPPPFLYTCETTPSPICTSILIIIIIIIIIITIMKNSPNTTRYASLQSCSAHLNANRLVPDARRYSTGSIGKLMGVCVLVKTLDVVSNVAYYQTYAATGRDSTQLHQLTHAAETLSGGAFLGLLLLLCLGRGITRPDLSRREKRMFWGVCVLYVVFGLLHSICETPSICQVGGEQNNKGQMLLFGRFAALYLRFDSTIPIPSVLTADSPRITRGT